MADFTLARAIHILAVVVWIGGVSFVTTVMIPSIRRMKDPKDQIDSFEKLEGKFAVQARIFTLLAALSGFWMLYRLDAWDWIIDPARAYILAMILIWLVFTVIVFVLEPLVLHKKLSKMAERNPKRAFSIIHRAHWVLLLLSLSVLVWGVLGAHGGI